MVSIKPKAWCLLAVPAGGFRSKTSSAAMWQVGWPPSVNPKEAGRMPTLQGGETRRPKEGEPVFKDDIGTSPGASGQALLSGLQVGWGQDGLGSCSGWDS